MEEKEKAKKVQVNESVEAENELKCSELNDMMKLLDKMTDLTKMLNESESKSIGINMVTGSKEKEKFVKDIKKLTIPLINYIREYLPPHTRITVSEDSIDILEAIMIMKRV